MKPSSFKKMLVLCITLLVSIWLVIILFVALKLSCCKRPRQRARNQSAHLVRTQYHDDGLPETVDLRVASCFPYIAAENQGPTESCVAFSFATALYCAKASFGLALLPGSQSGFPDVDALFRPALAESIDANHGVSFGGMIKQLRTNYGEDLRALGLETEEIELGENAPKRIRLALARGSPVVAGYQVDRVIDAFHRSKEACAAHGYLLPPFSGEVDYALSAHAVLLVGYNDLIQCFIARNSWGPEWGVKGHFLIRYSDVANSIFFTDFAFFKRHTIDDKS